MHFQSLEIFKLMPESLVISVQTFEEEIGGVKSSAIKLWVMMSCFGWPLTKLPLMDQSKEVLLVSWVVTLDLNGSFGPCVPARSSGFMHTQIEKREKNAGRSHKPFSLPRGHRLLPCWPARGPCRWPWDPGGRRSLPSSTRARSAQKARAHSRLCLTGRSKFNFKFVWELKLIIICNVFCFSSSQNCHQIVRAWWWNTKS